MINLIKNKKILSIVESNFIPKYDDVALFAISVLLLLIFLTNPEVLNSYLDKNINGYDYVGWLSVIVLFGIGASFYRVIFRKKLKGSNVFLSYYAILVNFIVGIEAYYNPSSHNSVYSIFPIINILNAFILAILLIFFNRLVAEKTIISRRVKYVEVLLTLVLIFVLFYFSQYILGNHWSITFSICLFYAYNLSKLVNSFFIKKVFYVR